MKKIFATMLFFTIAITTLSGCNTGQEQASVSGELTIAAFHDNSFLEFAARRYEELHEGVAVTVNFYAGEERDVAKYSQIINTALMSDRAEDIIDVSTLDWVRLADNNRILDLNGKIDFAPEIHYQSVLDAYLYEGGRYAIPLCFYFTVFRFDEAFAYNEIPKNLTLEGLMPLATRYPDNPLFISGSGLDALSLAEMMFNIDFYEFIDIRNKTANVDSEKFISLLNNINSIDNLRWPEAGETAVLLEMMLYNPAMTQNGVEDYTGAFLLTNDRGEGLFSPIGFLPSVNAKSANQELAIDFMRFLLSEEMQSSPELLFNPINKKASAEMAALVLAEVRAGGFAAADFDLEHNISIFNELAERAAVAKHSDAFINDFVWTEMTRFFTGEVNAEQAARNLQSRLNTYLNE
jgi:multiple sugar transport system substrate-binding protein